MSVLKKLAGQTAIYGLSSVLGRMLNYLLVPLYTSVFLPAEYGIVTELYAYVAFLNIVYLYGLETAYFRFSSKEPEENFFDIAVSSILLTSAVLSGIIWFFSNEISIALDYPDQAHLVRWLAAILAIDAIVAIPFAKLRQNGEAVKFAAFKLTNIGVNILLNLFFIIWCPLLLEANPEGWLNQWYSPELGVGYVFLSNLIANALYIVLFIPDWYKLKFSFHFAKWRKMLTYAWPILIIGFAGVTNEMLSRAILKYRLPEGFYPGFSNLEILGIFGACYKLSVFMTLAIQAFRYAFEPFFFSQSGDQKSPKVFANVMTGFVLFICMGWLSLCLFMPYYAPIFLRQPNYLLALDAVPLLLGGGLFLGIFYNLSLWYKLTDNTIYGAYISVFGALVTFVLNWTLIPKFGYMGSAIATFTTYFSMTVLSYFLGRKSYPVPYDLLRIAAYIGFATVGIVFNELTEQSLLKSVFIFVFFLVLLLITERRTFQRLKAK